MCIFHYSALSWVVFKLFPYPSAYNTVVVHFGLLISPFFLYSVEMHFCTVLVPLSFPVQYIFLRGQCPIFFHIFFYWVTGDSKHQAAVSELPYPSCVSQQHHRQHRRRRSYLVVRLFFARFFQIRSVQF